MPEPVPYQYPARTPPVPPGPSTWRVLGSVHGQRRAWRTHIASPQDGWPRDASYPPWGVPARPCAKDAHLTPWKAWDRRQGGEVHRLSGPKEHHGRVEETDGVCRAHTTDNSDPSRLLIVCPMTSAVRTEENLRSHLHFFFLWNCSISRASMSVSSSLLRCPIYFSTR